MSNYWVVSDTHFLHANILTFTRPDRRVCSAGEQQCDEACKATHPRLKVRDFASCEEMDETMVQRWNEVVRPQDHVWHLGDVTMLRGGSRVLAEPILSRLNGHKRLILGNHDHNPMAWYAQFFEKIRGNNVIDGLLMSHYPLHPGSLGKAVANVHGHIHSNTSLPLPYINVCVEVTDYRPVALEDLKKMVA